MKSHVAQRFHGPGSLGMHACLIRPSLGETGVSLGVGGAGVGGWVEATECQGHATIIDNNN